MKLCNKVLPIEDRKVTLYEALQTLCPYHELWRQWVEERQYPLIFFDLDGNVFENLDKTNPDVLEDIVFWRKENGILLNRPNKQTQFKQTTLVFESASGGLKGHQTNIKGNKGKKGGKGDKR